MPHTPVTAAGGGEPSSQSAQRARISRHLNSLSPPFVASAISSTVIASGPRASRQPPRTPPPPARTEEKTSEIQSLMRNWYAVFRLKKKKKRIKQTMLTFTSYHHATKQTHTSINNQHYMHHKIINN